MIGLIVQLTADYCKIWSSSRHRFIKYSRNYLPNGSHEGDWIEIEFDSSGMLKGINKVDDILETRRDERGKMQVLDLFLVDSRREEAFCETFEVVRIEKRKGGGEWIEERKAKDHGIRLWMTISSNAQFSIEEQSLDRFNPKDGKYSEKYIKLLDARDKMVSRSTRNEITESLEFDETIVIVGFDESCGRFFSSSRSGEAVIHDCVWKREGEVKQGDVFLATLCPISDPGVEFRVVHLKKRMALWKGVELYMNGKGLRARLTGKVVERRQTCFVLNTTPFGRITCPLDAKSLRSDTKIGDSLRVQVLRVKRNMVKDDHPSKWQVIDISEEPAVEEKTEWVEGIVTSINGPRVFISFKHGNAQYNKTSNEDINLSLGAVVHICVRDTGCDSFFDVWEIDNRTRKIDEIKVEEYNTVICEAEVIERRGGYFLLDTPIIGLAQFFFGECPDIMRVGDIWNVKMHRRKDKRDLPSHWVVHEVEGDSPRSTAMVTGRREGRERARGGKDREEEFPSLPSTNRHDDERQWGTVIITGEKNGNWFGSCHISDTVTIPHSLVRHLKVPKRGSFYRIKCSMEYGRMCAYDLKPEPVHPQDLEVYGDVDASLQVWCYTRIERSESTSFTLFNEMLGEATLPHKFAHSEMRVKDEIEALYYRVKTTKNPTHWMVQRVGVISSGSKRNPDAGWRMGENKEGRRGRSDVHSEVKSGSRVDTETSQSSSRIENQKDRRVLDIMGYFASLPQIREVLIQGNPKDLEVIDKILYRDRSRSLQ